MVETIGFVAGGLTTLAFVPQVVKTWRSKSADDLSAVMPYRIHRGRVPLDRLRARDCLVVARGDECRYVRAGSGPPALKFRHRSAGTPPAGPPDDTDGGSLVDQTMSEVNPLWGAPWIHGELLKLGISVSQAAVARYMPGRWRPASPTWRTSSQSDDAQTSRSRRGETLADATRPPSQVSRARSRCADHTSCARARPTAHDRQESAESVGASNAAVPEADDGGPGFQRATPP